MRQVRLNDLKVGDKIYIRDDLTSEYDGARRGKQIIAHIYDLYRFSVKGSTYIYSSNLVDWEKTTALNKATIDNICDLKVGDKVYIREDLKNKTEYGGIVYIDTMESGVMVVNKVFVFDGITVFKVDGRSHYFLYSYEMVDWDKTIHLRCLENLSGVHEEEDNQDNVHNPSHYGSNGKHGIECYKAIEYILDRLENVPEKYFGHVSNIVKYVWRCNDKNGYEDLDKASVYLDFMFREEEE